MNKIDWYKNAVIYQIYPKSFFDSNDDGIGDLNGIIQKVEYIKSLGVDCVWLCPCYNSPNDDNGYDISDYYTISKEYGDLNKFKELLETFHEKGIKVIMDLVVNHTSDEHHWFKESKKSKDNPYRDYYYWKDNEGKLPNNWMSCAVGNTWEYSKETDSYYFHLFSKKQPDLNWENPKVREEVIKIINFWHELGIDGFRCDVINYISKDVRFKNDNNPFKILKGEKYYANGPKIHEYLHFMYKEGFEKNRGLFLGETPSTTTSDGILYTDPKREELHLMFQFEQVRCDSIAAYIPIKFKLKKLKKIMSKWQYALANKGWNSLYFENHDQPRSISRFASDLKYHNFAGKMLPTYLMLMQGTPFIYQGQEIGMTNFVTNKLSDYTDNVSHNVFSLGKKLGLTEKFLKNALSKLARDHARTPMQWNSAENAGFTKGKPWMIVNENYNKINVESQENDKNSILSYYKKLIILRKENAVFIDGEYKEYLKNSNKFAVYQRADKDTTATIICNFSNKEESLFIDKFVDKNSKIVLSNYSNSKNQFMPYECRVYMTKN